MQNSYLVLAATLSLLTTPASACNVGDRVKCPNGGYCEGAQCCRDGSACPSAPNTFKGCQKGKATDCTTGPSPPAPPSPFPPPAPPAPGVGGCLCVFDIDRTLTGKQEAVGQCPGDVIQPGIHDSAYSGGTLTLSELAMSLAGTFCHECHLATISAGNAEGPGSPERQRLHEKLSAGGLLPTIEWNTGGCNVQGSPLVTGCADGHKQNAVPGIQQWYNNAHGVSIADQDVYFFDDRAVNVRSFLNTAYNARQISCATRDLGGAIGLCGARLSEVLKTPGVYFCGGDSTDDAALREFADGRYMNATDVSNPMIV